MLPRMRTIDQTAALLREADPQTAFTKTALRRLVVTGQLPSVRVGAKYLISLDALEEFLAMGSVADKPLVEPGIRRVDLCTLCPR